MAAAQTDKMPNLFSYVGNIMAGFLPGNQGNPPSGMPLDSLGTGIQLPGPFLRGKTVVDGRDFNGVNLFSGGS